MQAARIGTVTCIFMGYAAPDGYGPTNAPEDASDAAGHRAGYATADDVCWRRHQRQKRHYSGDSREKPEPDDG